MIARNMVMRWGMSPRVGPLNFPTEGGWQAGQPVLDRPYSEDTAALIDGEMKRIVQECLEEARRLLATHRTQLDALARALVREESLDEQQILRVAKVHQQPGAAAAGVPSTERLVG